MIHMVIKIDLTGKTFARVRVLSQAETRNSSIHWNCVCECGREFVTSGASLRSGRTKSCGCYVLEVLKTNKLSHGHIVGGKPSPTYNSWLAMKKRCLNPNQKGYNHYGGRGVVIHTEWITSFAQFLADMGDRPAGMTLDRIDCNGNYEPTNCKWSTISEQNANQRRWKR